MAANEGHAPPDFASEVGQVRLLIGDTDPTGIVDETGTYLWYSDEEIESLISLRGGVDRAAIHILRIVSMTPSMQLKKWSSADLAVDGPAITRALREVINDIEAGILTAATAAVADYFNIVYEPNGATVDALLGDDPLRVLAGAGGVPDETGFVEDPENPGYYFP